MKILHPYFTTIIIAAWICGILLSAVKTGTKEKLIRFLCGIFMEIVILTPLTGMDWTPELDFMRNAYYEGIHQSAEGERIYRQETEKIITSELASYIRNMGMQLGCDISAQVCLGEDNLPASVDIDGCVSKKLQESLTETIERDLGIPKEHQKWNG